ncbi:copper resistance D family protein [Nocardia mexicana]|uniref:Putative copper resistance protein D n=1 Tax=Nocardia mexicana TaxID=279262 RepID=A0A370GXH0_9NOCA|nr:CopD family protein [Nocardia mexicana]RDI48375.1 putative copper resistance protein D [Nocardia mexicana]
MSRAATGGSSTALRAALLLVVPAALLGAALAWALAAPDPVQSEAPVRALADCAGAVVLGLAALPRLHDRLRPSWRLLAGFGGLWVATEFAVLACEAAQVVGVPVTRLRLPQFGDYLIYVSGGQVGIAILIGTCAVTGYCALAYRRPQHATADLVLVFAAVALALRPITGHMSQQAFGSVVAAVHALAAAVWFGLLLALALVTRTRGEWAVLLPRYSAWALPALVAVTVTGICNGLVRLGGLTPLIDTGYGRILLAKTAVLAVLLALGWWWRRRWVPLAGDHRMTAESSLRRAVSEVVVMALVFGLAATLAVTA